MDEAFKSLVMPDRFVARLGPAINSGTAVPDLWTSGNGKTTISQIIGRIFDNVVYIPYCFEVDGFIFKVFDPSVHEPVESKPESELLDSFSVTRSIGAGCRVGARLSKREAN